MVVKTYWFFEVKQDNSGGQWSFLITKTDNAQNISVIDSPDLKND